jgi:hypothetical protein
LACSRRCSSASAARGGANYSMTGRGTGIYGGRYGDTVRVPVGNAPGRCARLNGIDAPGCFTRRRRGRAAAPLAPAQNNQRLRVDATHDRYSELTRQRSVNRLKRNMLVERRRGNGRERGFGVGGPSTVRRHMGAAFSITGLPKNSSGLFLISPTTVSVQTQPQPVRGYRPSEFSQGVSLCWPAIAWFSI